MQRKRPDLYVDDRKTTELLDKSLNYADRLDLQSATHHRIESIHVIHAAEIAHERVLLPCLHVHFKVADSYGSTISKSAFFGWIFHFHLVRH